MSFSKTVWMENGATLTPTYVYKCMCEDVSDRARYNVR